MLDQAARYWWVILIRGLLAVGFGVIAIAWPEMTILALVIVFGAYALIDGVLDVVLGIAGRGPGERRLSGADRTVLIVLGVVSVAAGVVALVWPGITAVALLWLIAFWAILSGVLELATAWRLRAELTNEWLWVLTGLLSIALGILLIVQPASGALALVIWIGVFAIAWGVMLAILSFRVRGLGPDSAQPAT